MRRTIHTLLCLLIFSHPVDASPSVQQLFDEGNELYRKGAYEEAYQRFDSITHLGYESADLYYNMGNVAYKLGNNPLAILNYERAKKLKPADRDTYFNLGMANLKNIDKIEALPEIFYHRWWRALYSSSTADTWSYYAIIFLALGFLGLVIFIIAYTPSAKKLFFTIGITLICISIFCLLCAGSNYTTIHKDLEAIVFQPGLSVTSSPNEQSTKLFIVHEGAKVSILESLQGWHKIMLQDGHIGWVPASGLEVI